MKNKTNITKIFLFILLFIQTVFTFISIGSEGLLVSHVCLLISQFSTIILAFWRESVNISHIFVYMKFLNFYYRIKSIFTKKQAGS